MTPGQDARLTSDQVGFFSYYFSSFSTRYGY